jgi:hypothetical protein
MLGIMKRTTLLLLLATLAVVGCGVENSRTPNSNAASLSLSSGDERTKDSAPPAQRTNLAAADDPPTDNDRVQADARKMVIAVYQADIDTVIDYTHPKIIDMMGGMSQARSTLETAFSQFRSLNMKLESLSFPDAPTFLRTDVNDFVIVPTLSTIVANGQRVESLNYQFGNRKKGTTDWKYIEGSRINKENVRSFFPDFPADYEFPPFYRKKL